ncbi:MAG TPA: 50S ribosomal protein L3 [Candidatus Dojkabacteria bacterium]|nr:50S ribosomal protein L3 [Candidatus Dojkabacteria bacterium]HRP51435.1 50S ribosomal protein L3 [Candidatus Dojkabacteria bacterium]
MKALLAQKREMTQIYDEDGAVIPVTILDVSDVYVIGIKNSDKDGYNATILGKGKKKNANKPEVGKYKKLGFVPNYIKEIRELVLEIDENSKLTVSQFKNGEIVSVTGSSKGKGFQGVVKRWNFHGGPKTHGQSDRWRAPGSIGSGTTPGRVYKGKKMAGRMGGEQVTVKNLEVVFIDEKNELLGIKGAVPGNKGAYILIKSRD